MPPAGQGEGPEGRPRGEGRASVPTVSRDDAEGLLMMEEGHSDLISFQPTDSDLPSFLEDCNRVRQRVRAPGPWGWHVAERGGSRGPGP